MKIIYKEIGEFYRVLQNESLAEIAKNFSVDEYILKKANGISEIKQGDLIYIPKSKVYFVKPFDTFESISKKTGVPVFEIKRKNNITNLFAGQIIFL